MQFVYHKNAADENLVIDGELHKYLFKVRRKDKENNLVFRNLQDKNLYRYEVINVSKKDANLKLISTIEKIVEPQKSLHIGWCKIDFKSIEKVIASLNEMGVSKITFIECEYSQRNTKINFEKLERLLINSSQQCGRSSKIILESCDSLEAFKKQYPDSYMFNFSSNHIDKVSNDIQTIILGCEGGFSANEIENFDSAKIVGIKSSLILRSESAAVTIASKIIL
jgi:16S rRNA (uracil1498-N3)-methyltransferase